MALDRKIAPDTLTIEKFAFPDCEKHLTPSGHTIYAVTSSNEEAIKLEIVLNAGICKQNKNALAAAANSLMSEGTKLRSSIQIADEMDSFGAYFQTKCLIDDSTITLYCLKKHLNSCLSVISDFLLNPQYLESERLIYINNQKERLKVQLEKTGYLCRKAFYKAVFSETSPIVSFSESIDYDNISRETLIQFHENHIHKQVVYIAIAGDVNQEVINTVSNFLNNFNVSERKNSYLQNKAKSENVVIRKDKSIQATLRVGGKMINRKHNDYRQLQLANLVLGGYFGSRLMKNIREDKGLTYGIYSTLESYLDDACFYVEADVNAKKKELVVAEITNELNMLCSTNIPEEELNKAKNYLIGSMLRGIDGPFSLLDRHRILIDYGFEQNYYDDFIEIIKSTTPEEIRLLTAKYFNPDNLVTVICGG